MDKQLIRSIEWSRCCCLTVRRRFLSRLSLHGQHRLEKKKKKKKKEKENVRIRRIALIRAYSVVDLAVYTSAKTTRVNASNHCCSSLRHQLEECVQWNYKRTCVFPRRATPAAKWSAGIVPNNIVNCVSCAIERISLMICHRFLNKCRPIVMKVSWKWCPSSTNKRKMLTIKRRNSSTMPSIGSSKPARTSTPTSRIADKRRYEQTDWSHLLACFCLARSFGWMSGEIRSRCRCLEDEFDRSSLRTGRYDVGFTSKIRL